MPLPAFATSWWTAWKPSLNLLPRRFRVSRQKSTLSSLHWMMPSIIQDQQQRLLHQYSVDESNEQDKSNDDAYEKGKELLNQIGFDWDPNTIDWKKRYDELVEYRTCHGNCSVPRNYAENPQLGTWVMTQRVQYGRMMNEGQSSSMTAERVALLEKIGFDWDPNQSAWNKRYDELVAYRERHGDCLVPWKYSENPPLGTWVMTQRVQYARMKEGKSSQITAERVALLDKIGFDWGPSTSAWNQRYDELVAYCQRHGNCLVPRNYAENPQLGSWVRNQRNNYRNMKHGKPSGMTAERIEKLERIGFVWSVRSESYKPKQ
ncbi:hypothetical protein ACA910_010387 [Epithemia clementina (nom. ined.)]